MKVCHLTSVHNPQDIRIFNKECTSLSIAGYDVSLVVNNYHNYESKGVKVFTVYSKSKFRPPRMIFTARKILKKALEIDAEIYHLHDPELLLISKKLIKKGKKVIYDSHEYLPQQILAKHYIPVLIRKPISKIAEKLENKISRRLSGIVCATPFIEERFKKINSNTININNYPILKDISYKNWDKKENAVCYLGGIFETRGIIELIKSLHNTDIKLHLAGVYSPESLRDKLVNLSAWKNVIEWGFVGREKINEILELSKVGIVTLHPTESYKVSLPVKLFEYMASGVPVVASNFPLWEKIVHDNNCGICVNPMDVDSIQKSIVYLLQNTEESIKMGKNGRKAIEEKYNWGNEEKKLLEFYKSMNSNEYTPN